MLKRNAAGATPADHSYAATVHHGDIDAHIDAHPDDDTGPRNVLGSDPNPDGKVEDRRCGAKAPDGTFSNPVTNVLRK